MNIQDTSIQILIRILSQISRFICVFFFSWKIRLKKTNRVLRDMYERMGRVFQIKIALERDCFHVRFNIGSKQFFTIVNATT